MWNTLDSVSEFLHRPLFEMSGVVVDGTWYYYFPCPSPTITLVVAASGADTVWPNLSSDTPQPDSHGSSLTRIRPMFCHVFCRPVFCLLQAAEAPRVVAASYELSSSRVPQSRIF